MTSIQTVRSFESLLAYLGDELQWPVSPADIEDMTFEYRPAELGITGDAAVNITQIVRIRPFVTGQPWSVFYIEFAGGNLPVVVLRRVLNTLIVRQRATKSDHQRWNMHDLLFISSHGAANDRHMTFAHFAEAPDGSSQLPTLRVLGWDGDDSKLRTNDVEQRLKRYFTFPESPAAISSWPQHWSAAFTLRPNETIKTTKQLSIALARLARDIRDRLTTVMTYEAENGQFTKLMASFKTALIHDLTPADFADMYAQTIAYGLLSTRIANPAQTSTQDFAANLQTNPFLRELMQTFLTMGGKDQQRRIDFDELGINDVIELLNAAQMGEVLLDFNNRNAHEDPVIHFYELFLKEYDAKKRMQRGVFYTPKPVVGYIVRSVHELLQRDFGLADGLADTTTWGEMLANGRVERLPLRDVLSGSGTERIDPNTPFVQILDPATGTGTFLVEVIDTIHRTMMEKWRGERPAERTDLWNAYVEHDLLPRLYGYELMMAPYAIAHLKIGLKLAETGYTFGGTQRAHVYLTNALEPGQAQLALAGIIPALAHEAAAVNTVKLETRFTVVVGNPPYSISSGNLSPETMKTVDVYKYIDKVRLEERGALSLQKNLQDDYVKFIRSSQLKLQEADSGVIGLITNNGYLDGRSFRGMRWNLANTFSLIDITDLHGSTKRIENSDTDDQSDENVFDITQGVCISFFARYPQSNPPRKKVSRIDIFGSREYKYNRLSNDSLIDQHALTTASTLNPVPPFYLFAQVNTELLNEYMQYDSLTNIFTKFSSGIKTHRDDFVVHFDAEKLKEHIKDFTNLGISDADLRKLYSLKDTNIWNMAKKRRESTQDDLTNAIQKCCYRPFDERSIIYSQQIIELPRTPTMRLMAELPNIALLCCQQQADLGFRHVFATRMISECCSVSNKTRETTSAFPIFDINRSSNFNSNWVFNLTKITNFRNEEYLLYYLYSILYSPCFRLRYSSFLMTDFPRIPLPGGPEIFHALVPLGEQLVALHLMESTLLDTPITHTVGTDWTVGKVGYTDGTVWIDGTGTKAEYRRGTTGFAGVPEEVWNFHIGGYQVCEKWLKDRKGRVLCAEDIAHYQKIVVALKETIRLMAEIDVVIDAHGGWPGAFASGEAASNAEPVKAQFGQGTSASAPKRRAAEERQPGLFDGDDA